MVLFSAKEGEMAAGTAVSGTALLRYEMNILTSTPSSDLLIVECQHGVCEAGSLLLPAFRYVQVKSTSTKIMDLTQF